MDRKTGEPGWRSEEESGEDKPQAPGQGHTQDSHLVGQAHGTGRATVLDHTPPADSRGEGQHSAGEAGRGWAHITEVHTVKTQPPKTGEGRRDVGQPIHDRYLGNHFAT